MISISKFCRTFYSSKNNGEKNVPWFPQKQNLFIGAVIVNYYKKKNVLIEVKLK